MLPEDQEARTIQRREAMSGRVSYSDPVILHESTRQRVVLIPFYIRRSDGNDLSVKILTYGKVAPPLQWIVREEKSVSLNESAARRLLRALKEHLIVAEGDDDGKYLLIRVSEGTAQLGEHNPAEVAAALARILSSDEIIQHLAETELSEGLIKAFRGAIRLSEMRSAVTQLRQYLEAGETSEQIYQSWCELHSWAFGNAYVMRDEVREISPGDHLDLILPTVISGYRDIVELKRPNMSVLLYEESHRNYYFSAEVSKAIGQSHRYLDVLHEVAARGLRDHPEIVAYHPRAIIVIGRSYDWGIDQLRGLHGLNRRLSGILVMTYDQLLAQGERLIEMLSAQNIDEECEASDGIEGSHSFNPDDEMVL